MAITELCVFGDSIGKGIVLRPDSSRYESVKMNLEQLFGRSDIQIKNYSLFGCTVTKGLDVIKRHACELVRYKNIFLELGGNDCDFDWSEIANAPEEAHASKTPLAVFSERYQEIISEIRKNGGNPILLTLPPLEPNRYFKWISKGLNADNILRWLGDVNMIYRWQELYNVEVMLLATRLSVPIIDIRRAFLKCNNYSDYLCSDGIHPNGKGYELIYKTIAEQY